MVPLGALLLASIAVALGSPSAAGVLQAGAVSAQAVIATLASESPATRMAGGIGETGGFGTTGTTGASTSGDASDNDIGAERQSPPSPPQVVQVRGELGKIEQALRGSMSRMVQSVEDKNREITVAHLEEVKQLLTPHVGSQAVNAVRWPGATHGALGLDDAIAGASGAGNTGGMMLGPGTTGLGVGALDAALEDVVPPILRAGSETAVGSQAPALNPLSGLVVPEYPGRHGARAGSEAEAESEAEAGAVAVKQLTRNPPLVFGKWGDLGPKSKCTLAR